MPWARRQQKFLDSSPSHTLHFKHSLYIVSVLKKENIVWPCEFCGKNVLSEFSDATNLTLPQSRKFKKSKCQSTFSPGYSRCKHVVRNIWRALVSLKRAFYTAVLDDMFRTIYKINNKTYTFFKLSSVSMRRFCHCSLLCFCRNWTQ